MILRKLTTAVSIIVFSMCLCQNQDSGFRGESSSGTNYYYKNLEIDKLGYYRVWIKTIPKDKFIKGKYINQDMKLIYGR